MFTNLLIVVAAGLLAPLALGFFPRVRLPAIVLEIVLGIVIGPSGLGWVKPDAPVSILALVGIAFLLFLSGRPEWRVARLPIPRMAPRAHRFRDAARLRAPQARQRPAVSGPVAGRPETMHATVRTRNCRHKE